MDGPQANQSPPQPPPSNQTPHPLSFLQEVEWSAGGLFLGFLLFASVLLTLNYFNILTLSKLYPNIFGMLPHRPYAQQQASQAGIEPKPTLTPSPTTSSPARKFGFGCPVQKEFCNSGKITKYTGDPALVYNLASGSSILSMTEIIDDKHIGIFQNPSFKTQMIYVAAKDINGSCYTLNYIVPDDIILEVLSFPISAQTPLLRIRERKILIGTEAASLILTVRKMSDPNNICTIKGNDKKEDGPFVPIESLNINFE